MLWISACDTSTGSLISEDVKDLLTPVVTTSGGEPLTGAANPSRTPLVTSVSPTVTIRDSNIILLIHGENLSDSLTVKIDDENTSCEVSELGNTSNGIVQTNLIEASCGTRNINNRVIRVLLETGQEILGSPIPFTGTSITLSTSTGEATPVTNSSSFTSTPSITSTPSTAELNSAIDNPFSTSTTTTALLPRDTEANLQAPTNLRWAASTNGIQLTWDSVERAQGYNVYVSNTTPPQPGVQGTTTYLTESTKILIPDATIDQNKFVVVKAFTGNTEGASSSTLKINLQAVIEARFGVQIPLSQRNDTSTTPDINIAGESFESSDQSEDGRYTVFLSRSAKLVSTPTLGHQHVYLHDKNTGAVKLISQSSAGLVSNADSFSPRISGDGSSIVFASTANNLDKHLFAAHSVSNIFSRNLLTGETQMLSASAFVSGASANANSFHPVIDSDGNNIVYTSYASDLTSVEKNQAAELFHFNRPSNTTNVIRITKTADSVINGNSEVRAHAISANGEYVIYSENLDTPSKLHRLN